MPGGFCTRGLCGGDFVPTRFVAWGLSDRAPKGHLCKRPDVKRSHFKKAMCQKIVKLEEVEKIVTNADEFNLEHMPIVASASERETNR